MLLAYLDESHDKSEYWIAGLIVPALRAQALENALETIVAKAEKTFPQLTKSDGKPIELHGHALAQGTDDWVPMKEMLRARLEASTRNHFVPLLAPRELQSYVPESIANDTLGDTVSELIIHTNGH